MSGVAADSPEELDPLLLALAFAQLYAEVESGRRPRTTVEQLLVPKLFARLGPWWVRSGAMRRTGPARGALVAPGRYEAVVLLKGPERWGALALRLERHAAGWRVTDACRPEDGPLPDPEPWPAPSEAHCPEPPEAPEVWFEQATAGSLPVGRLAAGVLLHETAGMALTEPAFGHTAVGL